MKFGEAPVLKHNLNGLKWAQWNFRGFSLKIYINCLFFFLKGTWQRRWAHQSRSLDVVLSLYWQREMLDCWHILADRDWWSRDHTHSRRYSDETWLSGKLFSVVKTKKSWNNVVCNFLLQSFPFFGVKPTLLDESGVEIKGEGEGYLVFSQPWPGMMRTLFNNHERFETTYFSKFPGFYCTGDGEWGFCSYMGLLK